MKVAILSMQRVDNYGSLLQAFSLMHLIESMGNSVQFVDIERIDRDNQLLMPDLLSRYGKHADDGLGRKMDRYIITRLINSLKTRIMLYKMEKFRVSELKIPKRYYQNNNQHFDVCVIGADEVFNCMQESHWGFTTQLYGNIPEAKKVITYAASCGSTTYDMLTEPMKLAIRKAFLNVSTFSVRDANTANFVKQLTKCDSQQNYDPALVFDFKPYIKAPKKELPQHYCLLYAYDKRIKNEQEIFAIQAFCEEHGLKLIIAYGGQLWSRNLVPFSPFELLYAFQKADMVITDTFHGAVFCIKYAKKFGVICRDSNRNKLVDLMKRTETEKHIINTIDELNSKFELETNRSVIDQKILEGYEKALEYLKKNI